MSERPSGTQPRSLEAKKPAGASIRRGHECVLSRLYSALCETLTHS